MKFYFAILTILLLATGYFTIQVASYDPGHEVLPPSVSHPPASFTQSVRVAKAYWGERHLATPCNKIDLMLVNRIPNPFVRGATGGASKGRCHILFTRDWFALVRDQTPRLCASVVHEVGHIDGLDHSSDPSNIMYFRQYGQTIPARCLALQNTTGEG